MRHEIGRVLQSVYCLEAVVEAQVLVGHMTVITRGVASMAGVAPRGLVRCHDVAVDAGRRVVAHKIGMRPEQVHKQSTESADHSRHYQQSYFLPI